jgi:hypothetical protein
MERRSFFKTIALAIRWFASPFSSFSNAIKPKWREVHILNSRSLKAGMKIRFADGKEVLITEVCDHWWGIKAKIKWRGEPRLLWIHDGTAGFKHLKFYAYC